MTDRARALGLTAARVTAERVTAEQSVRAQSRVAGALAQRGIERGGRVAFLCPSSAGLIAALVGALRAGIVPVCLNPSLLEHERRLLLDDADPGLVVEPRELASLLEGPEADLAPVPLARPMHYTSGTTGRPKGVWSGVLDETAAVALHDDESTVWGFSADDRLLVASPLHHSAPLRFSAGVLLAGGEVCVLERFDAAAVVEAVATFRPTVAFFVPAHLHRLFALGALPPLDSFRLLAHAGAPCPVPLKEAALAAFPSGTVWEFYGSTEGQFTVCSPDEWLARPGTVGRARPRRTVWVDDGTVWCDVPHFARFEYWRDPEKTAQAWRGSAFTVGDLGRIDHDGFLFLDGRRDDLIISGGVNVYPNEVEAALSMTAGIDEVVVFGVPDDRWGERVCAAVIGDVSAGAVVAHARATLAAYKCPKDVYLVDDLPRTASGKVRRSAVAGHLGLDVQRRDRG
jgi:acyl-CoA synthetase (AMP-forming)/AMP-acid ligase II